MAQMTGGQALVQSLKKHGLEVVFGLPGVQMDWLFDALYDEQDSIKVYHTRHEQATAYMADGYARTTGKVGASVVVPGPGLMNTLAALSTAYACSSPVLSIAGQIQSDKIERGHGLLHEIPDQLQMVRSATKWAARAMRPEEIPAVVNEAFRQLRSGRPRPVEIEIPPDVLQATADVMLLDPAQPDKPEIDPDLLKQAAKALGKAKKPIIFVGGGILQSQAWEPLQQLAEMIQAPVLMSQNGKGAISYRHYLAQSIIAGPELMPEADVVLVAGTRFLQPATSTWGPTPEQTVIQLDADPEEIGRNYKPNIGIVADAKSGLAQLAEQVAKYNGKRESRKDELLAVKERIDDRLFEAQPQASFGMAIREAMPDDSIFVSEVTQLGYWSNVAYPVYEPRTYISPGYQGTLGYGFATALGAQVGNPNKKVVSINGDGGFMYNVQELSTAVRHNINLIAIVFNDGAYGNVRRIQRQSFNGRTIASDLLNPDFMKLAEAFGVEGIRTETPDGLRDAVRNAATSNHPVLIEVPVGEMPSLWHLVRPGNRG